MNYNIYNTVSKIHFFNCRFKYQPGHILNLNKIVKWLGMNLNIIRSIELKLFKNSVITTKTMTKLTIMLTTNAHSSRTADNLTNTQKMKINSVLKTWNLRMSHNTYNKTTKHLNHVPQCILCWREIFINVKSRIHYESEGTDEISVLERSTFWYT